MAGPAALLVSPDSGSGALSVWAMMSLMALMLCIRGVYARNSAINIFRNRISQESKI